MFSSLASCTSLLMPLHKVFEHGGKFLLHLWMSVCACAFILIIDCDIPPPHWHLCTQPLPLLREGARDKQKKSSEKREDASSVKKVPPCQACNALEKWEIWHTNQSHMQGSWGKRSSRGGRNNIMQKGRVRNSGEGGEEKKRKNKC